MVLPHIAKEELLKREEAQNIKDKDIQRVFPDLIEPSQIIESKEFK